MLCAELVGKAESWVPGDGLGEVRDGFYITIYAFGYGEDEVRARIQWAIGLKLVENVIRQAQMV